MFLTICALVFQSFVGVDKIYAEEFDAIDVLDLTHPTNIKDLTSYYAGIENHLKICINCGLPGLGTGMHLDHAASFEDIHPADISPEYLLTQLIIIDVSHTMLSEDFALTLKIALQFPKMRHNPSEPTLLLFKFGWKREDSIHRIRTCVCQIPGLSYELAEYISTNMTHVMGVATDAPTLESEQTREFHTRTVSNKLGKNGVYMIENVNIKTEMQEEGCMSLAAPLKLLNANYVPTRLTAFCPSPKTDQGHVTLTLKKNALRHMAWKRIYDVNLREIMSSENSKS